jgi:lipopolysaccharide biosynthesis glycosyltransferase
MPDPQRHDTAVAFCCDRNYYHLALFMIWKIAHYNPHRRFDFVISSRDDLEVPDWAKPLGITLHRTGDLPEHAETARFFGSVAPLYRLTLVRELGQRYRRILYLDCDMFVEGGDINRLFDVDIGTHAIGAVLDAPFFYTPNYRAKEFVIADMPAHPYVNTGLQLIDTRAYAEQEVERRSFDMCKTHPKAVVLTDQSLTNLALRGDFALLAPCWNWQMNGRFPMMPWRYPVFLRHFIGRMKPDKESRGHLEARFNQAYRHFCETLLPEALPLIAPPCNPMPVSMGDLSHMFLKHILNTNIMRDMLKRFADPYKAET